MGMFMRNRHGRRMPTLNTASLPDLIFTMLFFFMLVTNMREPSSRLRPDLPASDRLEKAGESSSLHYIYIGMGTDGVQLDEEMVPLSRLTGRLSALSREEPGIEIALAIDRRVEMEVVNRVKQALREAGISVAYYLGDDAEAAR